MNRESTAQSNTAVDPRESLSKVGSVWQFAYHRLNALRNNPSVRREAIVVTLFMVAFFWLPALSWTRAWLSPEALQGYAIWVVPLTLFWLYLNRFRLAVPELDELIKRYREGKTGLRRNHRSGEEDREDREMAGVALLLKEKPPPATHYPGLLIGSCIAAPIAFWIGDPTLTALVFVAMVAGIVAYRNGLVVLKIAAFPLTFLLLLVPLPGLVADAIHAFAQDRIFSLVTHLILNSGYPVEQALNASPIRFGSGITFQIWAGAIGAGIAHGGFCLMLGIWFLSMVKAPLLRKVIVVLISIPWIGILLALRIYFLACIGLSDPDIVAYVAPVSLYFLPVIALAGQLGIQRALKCQNYQKWVSA